MHQPAPLAVLFTSPLAALAALAGAAAVPVVIHLLNRRRYRVVEWAAMRFLQAAQKRNVRRLRLEQLLLLAVRTLAVVLLAAAMASVTPWAESFWKRVLPGSLGAAATPGLRTHTVLVLDASFSMGVRDGDATLFDRAREKAEAVVRAGAAGDGFSVVLLGSPPAAAVPGPADDPQRVAQELQALQLPHGGADLAAGLSLVADLLRRSPAKFARREVLVFTDLQRSTWQTPVSDRPDGEKPADPWAAVRARASVAFVDVGRETNDNLAVTAVALADPLVTAGARTAVTATVHNFGPEERTNVRVELLVGRARNSAPPRDAGPGRPPLPPAADDGEEFAPRPVAQEIVSVPPGGAGAAVTFPLAFRTPGEYAVQVRLDADPLDTDNARTLVVNARDTVPVLLVNGKPAVDKPEQATYFLAKALNPFPDGVKNPLYPARPRVLSESEFADAQRGDLTGSDVVFLCDVPRFSEREAERLELHLRRGGGVVIALGPRADLEAYNKILYRNGAGVLPARLLGVARAPEDRYFTLAGDDEAFAQPPLAAFHGDDDRAGLVSARFRRYVRAEIPAKSGARRLLSFLPSGDPARPADSTALKPAKSALDPAVIEWPRHRGKVVLVTTTLNRDWSSWPVSPSFPPFVQELLRALVPGTDRRVATVGEPLEAFLPASLAGLEATVTRPDGRTDPAPVEPTPEGAAVRLPEAVTSGVYRMAVAGQPRQYLFAVNPPAFNPQGGSESDLRRLPAAEAAGVAGGETQVVTDPAKLERAAPESAGDGTPPPELPGVRGQAVARVLLLLMTGLLALEVVLAWSFGSARSARAGTAAEAAPPDRPLTTRLLPFALVGLCAAGGLVLAHAVLSGEFLGFLPPAVRGPLEAALGVPAAAPGEGTRWRLEGLPFLAGDARTAGWLTAGLALALLGLTELVYRRERPRTEVPARRVLMPLAWLRMAALLLAVFVLLPQLRLVFEREGWPDVAVIVDDSRSMSTTDAYSDPRAREAAAALAAERGLAEPQRLQLAQALLTRPDGDWLGRLVAGRQVKLHVFQVGKGVGQVASVTDPGGLDAARAAVARLDAAGESSPLGTAVRSVLSQFRGSSLSAVVMLTDGVTTDGEDVVQAARHAAGAGVPLYLVGLGDAQEPRDLGLSDLQVEDVVQVNDRLVFEARLTGRGGPLPDTVPVVLSERQGDRLVELARTAVRVDPTGKPVKFRVAHAPAAAGEKVYVVEVPAQPDEPEAANNRLERTVFVTDARQTRVLYVEGSPRYEFRFVKSLLERESAAERGNKTIDLKTLLLDADRDYAAQDKSAVSDFPTREELFAYDVVVLGDCDPRHPRLGERNVRLLADFVRERGGGLLVVSGEQFTPHAWRDTPLADLLPVSLEAVADEAAVPIRAGYRPRLTPVGLTHPVFRFVADEAENQQVWNRLQPMFWHAEGVQRKASAEVLAVHPDKTARGPGGGEERLPLALQQFVGAGRVMFFGFGETWRWRWRQDELRFNQFWVQTVRYLARNRLGRVEVRLDRQTPYRRGQPVRVTVRFPDDAPPPADDAAVRVLVERYPLKGGPADPETQTLQLAKVEGSRATYDALLTRTPEGEYRFSLASPAAGGAKPRADGRVLPPPGEMDRLRLNQADLERAAAESRGKYYGLADADRLPAELPAGERVALNQPRPPYLLWNHPAVFALALGLLTTEWVLRKRWRLA